MVQVSLPHSDAFFPSVPLPFYASVCIPHSCSLRLCLSSRKILPPPSLPPSLPPPLPSAPPLRLLSISIVLRISPSLHVEATRDEDG